MKRKRASEGGLPPYARLTVEQRSVPAPSAKRVCARVVSHTLSLLGVPYFSLLLSLFVRASLPHRFSVSTRAVVPGYTHVFDDTPFARRGGYCRVGIYSVTLVPDKIVILYYRKYLTPKCRSYWLFGKNVFGDIISFGSQVIVSWGTIMAVTLWAFVFDQTLNMECNRLFIHGTVYLLLPRNLADTFISNVLGKVVSSEAYRWPILPRL